MTRPDTQKIGLRGRPFAALALTVGACQVTLTTRLPYADDYILTSAIAWFGALCLAWPHFSREGAPAHLGPRVVGSAIALGTVVVLAATGEYRTYYRFLPLIAGAGLAMAATRSRDWLQYRHSLLMLALPLINSPPKPLHRLLDPVLIPITTWYAGALNRAVGNPVASDGHLLRMPNDTLDVVDGCSGLWAITRLCVLAALVLAFFPTTARQRVALFVSALLVGLCINTVRVAVLAAAVLHANERAFAYWHVGPGATLFALASSAAAGLAWWLLLRLPARARLQLTADR
jgi:cyanoexosortase A